MRSKEWSLIVFTILIQMAVGIFLVSETVWRLGPRRYDRGVVDALVTPVLLLVIPLLAVGGMVAAAHLARPNRALRVIANLRTSWLSREMLLSGLFGVAVGIYVAMRWFEMSPVALQDIMALSAASSGITLIYGMSRLYMLRTVPAWNTAATPLLFLQTTLLLGALGVSVVLALRGWCPRAPDVQCALQNDILNWTVPSAIVLACLQLGVIVLYTATLTTQGSAATQSIRMLLRSHRWVFSLRLLLAILSVGLLVLFIQNGMTDSELNAFARGVLVAAFGMAMLAEVLGRFLFYASYKRTGL